MLDSFEVLSWLNQFDRSHLGRDARALTRAARDVRRSDAGVERIIARLEALRQASRDPLEAAEISLHCAAVEIRRGMYVRAIRHAREAGRAYRADDHRRAVARWLMGMAQWERLQNHSAYRNWDGARILFTRRQRFFRHSPNERGWYRERLWLMEIELAGKPEEIYTWLNRFEASKLSPPLQQVVEAVQEKIRRRAYPDVYAMIRDLQEVNKWSKEVYERAEVLLECGLTAYQMGNIPAAIELLKGAVADFSPGIGNNHKQAVARSMLGAVEWMTSIKHNQATIDWRRCIDDFEQLGVWADKNNKPKQKKWYVDHRHILQDALSERLLGVRPGRRRPRRPAQGRPRGGPNQPVNEPPVSPDRYDYLLTLARGDRGVADRLIEHERKNAPNADRRELIERAITRWLREMN